MQIYVLKLNFNSSEYVNYKTEDIELIGAKGSNLHSNFLNITLNLILNYGNFLEFVEFIME